MIIIVTDNNYLIKFLLVYLLKTFIIKKIADEKVSKVVDNNTKSHVASFYYALI
jgi:hypothetical protein